MPEHADEIREPAAAGRFYPGSPTELRAEVEKMLQTDPDIELAGPVRALIAPHAGYTFSGATAGKAFALASRNAQAPRRVLVLAPSHYVGFEGIALSPATAFRTPLGDMPVDTDAVAALSTGSDLVTQRADAHRNEHALEVQVPFVQALFPDAMLVPAVCGQMREHQIREVARVLANRLWTPDTLWVVSTDFTHYGRDFGYVPFSEDVERKLRELDMGAVEQIVNRDMTGFLRYVGKTGATICGAMPVAVLLAALDRVEETATCKQVAYTTSADVTGDFRHTVSYVSMVVTT